MVSAVGLVPTPGVVMVAAMEGAVIEYLRSITQYDADSKNVAPLRYFGLVNRNVVPLEP